MYQGFDKDNGGIIGDISGGAESVDLTEAADSTSAEEILMCQDEEGNQLSLTAVINPETGELTWNQMYDRQWLLSRTIAMSQMTSMLRDIDRNSIYERAIAHAIGYFTTNCGRAPTVMDIGTGTGLLALLAVKVGAQFVVGLEMFDEMANVAQEIMFANDGETQVMIVNGKSTEVESLPFSPDIVVSEILDSALLGESILVSHADAVSRFMVEGSTPADRIENRVIPHSAFVFGTLVESLEVKAMHDISSIGLNGDKSVSPWRSDEAPGCMGGWPLIPIHWNALEARGARKISQPTKVLDVAFYRAELAGEQSFATDILVCPENANMIAANGSGGSVTVHGILLWWQTFLLSPDVDPLRQCMYSTEPNAQNWQDHWTQTIFPLPHDIVCSVGDWVRVVVTYDASRMWVSAVKQERHSPAKASSVLFARGSNDMMTDMNDASATRKRTKMNAQNVYSDASQVVPLSTMPKAMEQISSAISPELCLNKTCGCGWHILCGTDRIQMLNDLPRSTLWNEVLTRIAQNVTSRGLLTPAAGASSSCDAVPNTVLSLSDCDVNILKLCLLFKARGVTSQNLRIVSKEPKFFSRMLMSQLSSANELDELLMLWNGCDIRDIPYYFEECDDMQEDAGEGEEDAAALDPAKLPIAVLLSECFHYQLTALPTWAALSFHYQRTALQSYLHPNAMVVPCCGFVMVAPVELIELNRSHGTVDNVHGFDHRPLDARQENWHEHLYPYKLANYRHRLLAPPTAIRSMNFMQTVHSLSAAEESMIAVAETGRCDAVAIWMDYQLLEDDPAAVLRTWNQGNFNAYSKINIKYFSEPIAVNPACRLRCRSSYELGASDFGFAFEIS